MRRKTVAALTAIVVILVTIFAVYMSKVMLSPSNFSSKTSKIEFTPKFGEYFYSRNGSETNAINLTGLLDEYPVLKEKLNGREDKQKIFE